MACHIAEGRGEEGSPNRKRSRHGVLHRLWLAGRWLCHGHYPGLMSGPDGVVIGEAWPEVGTALVGFDPMAQAGDATRRADIAAWVAAGHTLVAQSGGEIHGYVVTSPGHLFHRDFVAMLIVHPSHRRRGIGGALLDEAVKRAGGDRVFTSTNASNAPMKALLASRGWLYSGTLDGLDPGDPEEFYYIDRYPH